MFVDRLGKVGLNATGHQSFSCHFIGLKINKIVAHLGIELPHINDGNCAEVSLSVSSVQKLDNCGDQKLDSWRSGKRPT